MVAATGAGTASVGGGCGMSAMGGGVCGGCGMVAATGAGTASVDGGCGMGAGRGFWHGFWPGWRRRCQYIATPRSDKVSSNTPSPTKSATKTKKPAMIVWYRRGTGIGIGLSFELEPKWQWAHHSPSHGNCRSRSKAHDGMGYALWGQSHNPRAKNKETIVFPQIVYNIMAHKPTGT